MPKISILDGAHGLTCGAVRFRVVQWTCDIVAKGYALAYAKLAKASDARSRASFPELLRMFTALANSLSQDLGLHFLDAATISRRARGEGMSFLTCVLPSLAKAMEKGIATGHFSCPSTFKRHSNKSELPAFMGQLFRSIFECNGALRPDADATAVKKVRQLCYFAYKADLPRDPSLDLAVVDRFVEVEQELSAFRVKPDALLRVASLYVSQVTDGYRFGTPKHGPGIASNVDISQKNEARLTAGLGSVAKHGTDFFLNWRDAFDRVDRFPVWATKDYFGRNATNNFARVLLVPKDSRGPRLISAEPFENQYAQQGIASWLIKRVEGHPLTAGHVNFTDQRINQTLAKEASETRYWATLDLKDASDRVSMALVRELFKNEDLLADLEACRSTYTQLPSVVNPRNFWFKTEAKKVFLHKHAPMGSALCFPIMALSLWAILVAGLTGIGEPEPTSKVFVYGDDIIVPSEHATFLSDLLERYGLRVNREKSFINSYFAESCGADFFKGQNVTPVRLHECNTAKKPNLKTGAPEVLVGLTATANLLTRSSLTRVAESLYRRVERWLGPLPFGHSSSPYLCREAPASMDGHIPEMNIFREGLKWKTGKPYNPLGHDLMAWVVSPIREERHETLQGALMRMSSRETKSIRTRGRCGWSYSSVPIFVGTEAQAVDFGYVTKPRKYSLRLRRQDNFAMSSVRPWNGDLLLD